MIAASGWYRARRVIPPLLGLAGLVAAWEMAARFYSGIAIAGPGDTFRALGVLLADGRFLREHFGLTVLRVLSGLGLGLAIGLLLGMAAGIWPVVRRLLSPLRWLLMSLPGVVVVMVAMLWLGMGSAMVLFIVTSMISPVIYVNVVEGLVGVDRGLLEMARVYRFPWGMRLRRIYLMAMAGPLISGGIIALGNAIRIAVLAEALGANQGLGHYLALARSNLDTAGLYALVLLSLGVIGLVELLIMIPLRRKLLPRLS